MKFISAIIFLMVLVVLFTAGCMAYENVNPESVIKMASDETDWTSAQESPSAPIAMNVRATIAPSGYGGNTEEKPVSSDQKIIKTAEVKIEVQNVSSSAEIIQNITEKYDGIIQSSSIIAGTKNKYSGTVVVRIPADSFDIALLELKSIGKILSSSIRAEDVTEEYIDLVAQKNSLSNQLEQYNRLLVKGQNVSEILEVQKEIERVQVQLNRIVGRMKYLDNRTSFSTITINLLEPAQVETPSGYSIPEVISEGIEGFFNTVVWLFIVILTLLPLILVGGAGFFVFKRWKKNRIS